MARRNRKLVPGCEAAIDRMKVEIASEFGVQPGAFGSSNAGFDAEFAGELGAAPAGGFGRGYGGNLTAREAGSVGGEITKRLVRQAQQTVL